MPEVPHPGKHHGHAQPIGGFDHFLIAYGTPRLNDGRGPCSGYCFQPIGEGEKGVGGGDRVGQRQRRFHRAKFRRIHAAHLACTHSNRLPIAGVDDGI